MSVALRGHAEVHRMSAFGGKAELLLHGLRCFKEKAVAWAVFLFAMPCPLLALSGQHCTCLHLGESGHAFLHRTCLLLMLWTAPALRHQECPRVVAL